MNELDKTGLEACLRKLVNEVAGLGMFGPEIKALIGNTNWEVLALRVQEAHAVLAEVEESRS